MSCPGFYKCGVVIAAVLGELQIPTARHSGQPGEYLFSVLYPAEENDVPND